MRHFSFALGVRCQHCHVGGDGVSFEGVEFDKDGPTKKKARFMLRMTRKLNKEILPEIPERDTPPLRIECKTLCIVKTGPPTKSRTCAPVEFRAEEGLLIVDADTVA